MQQQPGERRCLCGDPLQHPPLRVHPSGHRPSGVVLPLRRPPQHHYGGISDPELSTIVRGFLCGGLPQHHYGFKNTACEVLARFCLCEDLPQHHYGPIGVDGLIVALYCLCGDPPQHHHGIDSRASNSGPSGSVSAAADRSTTTAARRGSRSMSRKPLPLRSFAAAPLRTRTALHPGRAGMAASVVSGHSTTTGLRRAESPACGAVCLCGHQLQHHYGGSVTMRLPNGRSCRCSHRPQHHYGDQVGTSITEAGNPASPASDRSTPTAS
jgi:hypothetical protein